MIILVVCLFSFIYICVYSCASFFFFFKSLYYRTTAHQRCSFFFSLKTVLFQYLCSSPRRIRCCLISKGADGDVMFFFIHNVLMRNVYFSFTSFLHFLCCRGDEHQSKLDRLAFSVYSFHDFILVVLFHGICSKRAYRSIKMFLYNINSFLVFISSLVIFCKNLVDFFLYLALLRCFLHFVLSLFFSVFVHFCCFCIFWETIFIHLNNNMYKQIATFERRSNTIDIPVWM